ncbi:aminomethyltransferase family protein [Tumebacillus sp. ITR2]|uniref:Aminomethyltransferase family protein n=1 Tax=Tumebacillus amylolyticus TaxID=2801339 RepID=A0ABS1JA47_9BACL|nr:aminomethyltransferase family protein [Tumebacillus amylolyticus]MBL0387159.1 aminomethyltransferase family protein [Tumebacillus amylolyticus]
MKTSILTQATQANGNLIEVGGHAVVATYTTEGEEYDALRNGIGIYDLSAVGKFEVGGDEHVNFLNELVTKDIEFLDVEKSIFTLLLNEEGNVIDAVTLHKKEESIIIETSVNGRDAVGAWLQERKTDEVEITDLSDDYALIAFEGPYSWKAAASLIDYDISLLPFQAFVATEIEGSEALLFRNGVTGEYGYKVLLANDAAVALWEKLVAHDAASYPVKAVGHSTLEIAMLEVRQPNVLVETEGLNVFESSLEWVVSFYKENFVGRDALDAKRGDGVNRRIVGFSIEEGELSEQDSVVLEDETIGTVLQVRNSGALGKKLGLALVDELFAVSGIALQAQNQAGERVTINTISSPYILPKSWAIKIA